MPAARARRVVQLDQRRPVRKKFPSPQATTIERGRSSARLAKQPAKRGSRSNQGNADGAKASSDTKRTLEVAHPWRALTARTLAERTPASLRRAASLWTRTRQGKCDSGEPEDDFRGPHPPVVEDQAVPDPGLRDEEDDQRLGGER